MSEWIFAGKAFVDGKVEKEIWVEIEGGIIKSVIRNSFEWNPEEGEILKKFPNGFLMPGMIDTHVHLVHDGDPDEDWKTVSMTKNPGMFSLEALKNAKKHIYHGITTVRDLGSRDLVDVCVRDFINSGVFIGPRIIASGHPITSTGGHMDSFRTIRSGMTYEMLGFMGLIADSVEEARKAVRRNLMDGVDVIKINVSLSEHVRRYGEFYSPEMTLDVLKEICDLSHEAHRKVTGHSHGGAGVDRAINAGIDSFEHARFFTDEQFKKMADKEIYLTPTLSPDARPPEESRKQRSNTDNAWIDKAKSVMFDSVKRAAAHGVKITSGSDAGMSYVNHGEVAWEIELLGKAGLSNVQCLLATTSYAAENLGIADQTGAIKKGLDADLLVLKKDPSEDITVLKNHENIELIMKSGKIIQ